MSSIMKVGIIGIGRIGKVHGENIRRSLGHYAQVKAVSDVRRDSIVEWASDLGIQNVYPDYRTLLEDPEIKAVLICSSTDTHADISVEAAKAGKHIFCEKPVDLTVEKINAVRSAVESSNVKFQVGFNRRFDHNFSKVKEMIGQGKIGHPQIIKITSRDPQPPPIDYIKVSGGMFLDMSIHDFDMARYLTGSEVIEVYASGAAADPAIGLAGDVDTAVIMLKFENGAIGVIDNSRRAVYGYDQRVEVFGSAGCIEVHNDTQSSAVLSNADGVISENPKYFFMERYKESFIEEMKAFFEAILHDQPTPVTGMDGLKPVIIGLAAKKSCVEGRPVVIEP